MKINRGQSRKARIEMVPLVDMFFLVLVFFIYAMLSMAVHRALPVQLPTSSSAELNQKTLLSVTVKEDGSLFLDKVAVSRTGSRTPYASNEFMTLKRRSSFSPTAGCPTSACSRCWTGSRQRAFPDRPPGRKGVRPLKSLLAAGGLAVMLHAGLFIVQFEKCSPDRATGPTARS